MLKMEMAFHAIRHRGELFLCLVAALVNARQSTDELCDSEQITLHSLFATKKLRHARSPKLFLEGFESYRDTCISLVESV